MRIRTVFHTTALVLLASCNPITQACTLIGCEDGLAVRLNGAPAGPYRVEAWSELRIAPTVYECGAAETCPPIFFPGFAGNDVVVRVTTAAGVRTQAFDGVEYQAVYPNGRRCGGACEQAVVTVQL